MALALLVVLLVAGGGLDRVDVGSRVGLGDGVALFALAGDRGPDVALELVGRGHRGQPGGRGGGHPAQRVGDPAHLLLHQDLLQGGIAAATEFPRHVSGVQAELEGSLGVAGGHVGRELAAGAFGRFLERDQLVGETAGPGLDLAVFFGEPVHRWNLRGGSGLDVD